MRLESLCSRRALVAHQLVVQAVDDRVEGLEDALLVCVELPGDHRVEVCKRARRRAPAGGRHRVAQLVALGRGGGVGPGHQAGRAAAGRPSPRRRVRTAGDLALGDRPVLALQREVGALRTLCHLNPRGVVGRAGDPPAVVVARSLQLGDRGVALAGRHGGEMGGELLGGPRVDVLAQGRVGPSERRHRRGRGRGRWGGGRLARRHQAADGRVPDGPLKGEHPARRERPRQARLDRSRGGRRRHDDVV